MSPYEKAKKRPLSTEETGWIDRATETIQDCNNAIIGLSALLVSVAELAATEHLDPHFKDEICRRGTAAIAYGIMELAHGIADRQEFIEDTLRGITTAEMQGRSKQVSKFYRRGV